MKNIIVRIRGGLGNQLFIIGYAMYIQSLFENAKLICDCREYDYYKIRNYELSNLKVDDALTQYKKSEDKSNLKYEIAMKILHSRMFIKKKLGLPFIDNCVWEEVFNVIYNTADINPQKIKGENVYLYGYFVNVKPLLKIRDRLVASMEVKIISSLMAEYMNDVLQTKHSVAISMRFGQDYIANKWPICSLEYYDTAMKQFDEQDTVFFVFSDEIEQARKYLRGRKNIRYVENCSPCEQMSIMKQCDDFIISNSTFSWWGAFLGKKDDRIIYAPEIWHDKKTKDSRFFFDNIRLISSAGELL